MNTLLIAEHNNATLADATVKAVSAAAQMDGDLHILVAGEGCAAVADQAAKLEATRSGSLLPKIETPGSTQKPPATASLVFELARGASAKSQYAQVRLRNPQKPPSGLRRSPIKLV